MSVTYGGTKIKSLMVRISNTMATRPTGKKSELRREAIIKAAITVFNAKGFEPAKMVEIAGLLGMTDASLYYYFSDKQHLVYACHLWSLARFEALLLEAEEARTTGLEKLRLFLRLMIHDGKVHGSQLYFGDHSYLSDEPRRHVDDWAVQLTGSLELIVEAGIKDGSIVGCEVRLAVQLLLGMLIWLAKWVPATQGLTPERLIAAIDTVSIFGLKA